MYYTAVVIDNNRLELSISVEMLLKSKIFQKIVPFDDAEEAIQYIDDNGCDVLFTEIDMKKIDGFALGKIYGKRSLSMCFVFLTNNENYALEAFKLNVNDFALKPLDNGTIKRIAKKVKNKQYFEASIG